MKLLLGSTLFSYFASCILCLYKSIKNSVSSKVSTLVFVFFGVGLFTMTYILIRQLIRKYHLFYLILTLIPCMCISPLKGVHSSFSLDSGSSMIFPLRDDRTSPDADDMTSSWIWIPSVLKRFCDTALTTEALRLCPLVFCNVLWGAEKKTPGQRATAASRVSRGGHFQPMTRDIIIIVGREFSQNQEQICNNVFNKYYLFAPGQAINYRYSKLKTHLDKVWKKVLNSI